VYQKLSLYAHRCKRLTSAQHGDLVGAIEDRTLTATEYSPPLLHISPA
jgi:hypothetical protein